VYRKRINTRERDNTVSCLEDDIEKFSEELGIEDKMTEIKIFEVWNSCVGEKIAKFAVPVGLRKNKLMVSVENAVWRYELSNRKEEIIIKLNTSLKNIKNKKTVRDIIFV
jgi:predicted nucleic acid-binding Zn ribbon protein